MASPRDRHKHILSELSLYDISVMSLVPKMEQSMARRVLLELEHVMFPEEHERKIIPYGAIVLPNTYVQPRAMIPKLRYLPQLTRIGMGLQRVIAPTRPRNATEVPIELADLNKSRAFANGQQSFLVSQESGYYLAVFDSANGSERSMLQRAAETSGVIVQLLEDGTIRIAASEQLYYGKNRRWRRKESPSTLARLASRIAPSAGTSALEQVLRFAHQMLSGNGIGATFVVALGESKVVNDSVLRRLKLSIFDISQWPLLAHRLQYSDNATDVAADGRIVGFERNLTAELNTANLLKTTGGSRHASAKRYSFDHPECMVVVVSADGPISVFSDGHRLEGTLQVELTTPGESLEGQEAQAYVTCGTCKKSFAPCVPRSVQPMRVSLMCPLCNNEITGVTRDASHFHPWKVIPESR